MAINFFWFRRDLRLEDNVGLNQAIASGQPVQCLFIFDSNIIDQLEEDDPRITFIHQRLCSIDQELRKTGGSLLIKKGDPKEVWKKLLDEFEINAVFANKDYEPYAITRDKTVRELLEQNGISYQSFKDQVIFEEGEIMKSDGDPYTVFTPYKNKWLASFEPECKQESKILLSTANIHQYNTTIPNLKDIGFQQSHIHVKDYRLDRISEYANLRDYPSEDAGSYLSPHLRFGTVSIRDILRRVGDQSSEFLNELIWREFFMQILYHFPHVVTDNFRKKYDNIQWRNNPEEFERWCKGETGYPLVDAGMRQLNETGYMHNRVRMITAGFLCKHLLIDWRWGEAYFAKKLLDYELSSNNGNWQWAAGTGCDAAPYFRIFNPDSQLKKFDPQLKYVREWVKNFDEMSYPTPIVEHKFARERALSVYKSGIIHG